MSKLSSIRYSLLTYAHQFGSKLRTIISRIGLQSKILLFSLSHSSLDRWKDREIVQIRKILSVLSTSAEMAKVDLVLTDGSLLGYVRHGTIMKWDDDVDLGISEDELPEFLKSIATDTDLLFDKYTFGQEQITYYKFWKNDGKRIAGNQHTFPFVDIWPFTKQTGSTISYSENQKFPYRDYYPLTDVIFEGSKFKTPSNPMACLDNSYPGWRSKIEVYGWSHKHEKWGLRPITLEINVDSNGRITHKI